LVPTCGLARALWQCSRADEALAHWRDLLRLDRSESAIEKARTGFYTDSIADEVSAERLQRFFV
jgi:hypothetical protein